MKMVRGIVLAENEVVIREYEASALEVPKAEGYVIVTNRRVVFTGSSQSIAGSGLVVRDVKVDSISGVVAGLVRNRSFKLLILGVLLALVGLFMTFKDLSLVSSLILIIGAICLYFGLKSKGMLMYINILGSQSSSALSVTVESSSLFSRVRGNEANMTISAAGPGRHTEQMLREIGALIQDVQVMGDMAIEKWKNAPISKGEFQAIPVKDQLALQLNTVVNTANKVKESTVLATQNFQDQLNNSNHSRSQIAATMQCKCGAVLEADSAFCPDCGARQ